MEGIARLKSMTGEVVKIFFDLIMQNPGHKSNIYSVANIEIYLDVPPNRPFPDYVLVKLHFLPPPPITFLGVGGHQIILDQRSFIKDEGNYEFQLAYDPMRIVKGRTYYGQLNPMFKICSSFADSISLSSYKQEIEFVLVRNGHKKSLVDPINQTTQFQIDLWASRSKRVRKRIT